MKIIKPRSENQTYSVVIKDRRWRLKHFKIVQKRKQSKFEAFVAQGYKRTIVNAMVVSSILTRGDEIFNIFIVRSGMTQSAGLNTATQHAMS